MRRLSAALCLACFSLVAQDNEAADIFAKAPPEVDAALRSRVAGFLQAHVDAKFRAAEAFVAPDSQDIFYNSEKRQIHSFDIIKIAYTENYTKANVVTAVEMTWRTARVTMRVKPAINSTWRLENGEWFWYVIPRDDWETPFGVMKEGPEGKITAAPALSERLAPEQILSMIRLSRSEVEIPGGKAGSAVIELTNAMPGEIRVEVDNNKPLAGITVEVDKPVVPGRGTARIQVNYEPVVANFVGRASFAVLVQPTNQRFPVEVTITSPERASAGPIPATAR